MQCSIFTYSCW